MAEPNVSFVVLGAKRADREFREWLRERKLALRELKRVERELKRAERKLERNRGS